ncbi:uncharacterized protein LOC123318956 [Coccinella septempunctata]|uniref:uncharacterized protein LOC123318956 n=1 Tax=Coccinella septempunctata TaxID=41139 RepID=UPI001D0787DA|nr:uncharacterized protein LOC123318956 [Coccinella septempunctata]
MDEHFYDSLEEDSFCECLSDLGNFEDSPVESVKQEEEEQDDLSEIIPLYQRETPKTTIKSLKREGHSGSDLKKPSIKEPIPIKPKKENRTYLNLFHSKIKYPAIGGGDVAKLKTGSETTRAHYDPSSRRSSAMSRGRSEDFTVEREYSSDESSFYEKFIAEEELKRKNPGFKSTSGTMSNLLSVSEQCLSNTELNKPKGKRRVTTKASSMPNSSVFSGSEDNKNIKLQLLRKRQYYGKKASSRNKAIMEETKFIKNFNTKLKLKK